MYKHITENKKTVVGGGGAVAVAAAVAVVVAAAVAAAAVVEAASGTVLEGHAYNSLCTYTSELRAIAPTLTITIITFNCNQSLSYCYLIPNIVVWRIMTS